MDVRNVSDAQLVRLCASSFEDQVAWNEFFSRFHRHIALFVIRAYTAKSGRRLRPEASDQWETVRDLVQQVYLRLLEHEGRVLGRFQGQREQAVQAYLARVASTVVLDYLRRRSAVKRAAETVSLDELLLDEEKPPAQLEPFLAAEGTGARASRFEEWITIEDVTCRLERLLDGEEKRRDILIFVLHAFHGLTAEEIASRSWFGLTRTGVQSALRRVKRTLRRALRSEPPNGA